MQIKKILSPDDVLIDLRAADKDTLLRDLSQRAFLKAFQAARRGTKARCAGSDRIRL